MNDKNILEYYDLPEKFLYRANDDVYKRQLTLDSVLAYRNNVK